MHMAMFTPLMIVTLYEYYSKIRVVLAAYVCSVQMVCTDMYLILSLSTGSSILDSQSSLGTDATGGGNIAAAASDSTPQ